MTGTSKNSSAIKKASVSPAANIVAFPAMAAACIPVEKDCTDHRELVDGLWPRGIAKGALKYDAWPRALAPSKELRKWYGHNRSRVAEFRRRYRKELSSRRDELAALRATIAAKPATLLTATRELELSHAMVLRDVLAGAQPRSPAKRDAEV